MEKSQAEDLLRQMLGPEVKFRAGQWEAIDLVANQRRRLLVVQRTGWGKSVVYFLAAKILREAGGGPTLLISPLLALMRNQILAATKLGIHAEAIHSQNREDWEAVEKELREGRIDVLMVSPERLGNEEFLRLLAGIQGDLSMLVVDEAHCISDWGHDFRPDYRRIVRIVNRLPPKTPVLCTTATANDRVVADIRTQIQPLEISRGPLVRNSLRLFNVKMASQAERLAWLVHFLPQLPGSGIVYTLTVDDSRRVALFLQQHGLKARAYHADMDAAAREEAEMDLLGNKIKVLVATVALGMGYDKPDLGFVVHFQRPGSVVAYYQQVGRAGRAVDSAFGVLMSGSEDDEIQEYFIHSAFPPLEVMRGVLEELEKGGPLTLAAMSGRLNHSRSVLQKALNLLSVDGAVRHAGAEYFRSEEPWQPDAGRYERVTRQRRSELEEIKRYVDHEGCLMEFLARSLDDHNARPCGKCMNCAHQTSRRQPPVELVSQAIEFLRSDTLELVPRCYWPTANLEQIAASLPGTVQKSAKGAMKAAIAKELQAGLGRVLCVWGDAGWGREVARGKYDSGRFGAALVRATVGLIRDRWKPEPPPEWVTAIPSLHRPGLVPEFAAQVAKELGLPFLPVIRKVHDTRPQKEMNNSAQQLSNLLGAFAVDLPLPRGPVLLIDDLVDSGWTLALVAVLLRLNGSGVVHPFALAKSTPRGG